MDVMVNTVYYFVNGTGQLQILYLQLLMNDNKLVILDNIS